MEWSKKYPKNKKPAYSELLNFFSSNLRDLFLSFDREMNEQFKVNNKYHRYSHTCGWTYGYGRSYNCELLTVTVSGDSFNVLGVSVIDDASLKQAIEKAKKSYENGFEERYAKIAASRRQNQIARSKKRVEREKLQMEKVTENIEPEKFNQFKWSRKVSRSDLSRLYQSDAKGMLDTELLEEIGAGFYTRCKEAKEIRELMDKGQIKCFNCGAILKASGYASPIRCECDYTYTYREYRRSCNAASMPGGRATPIFEDFIQKWPSCRDAIQKMLLIDWLIHECHVTLMSGGKGRSVCANLIEGSLKQISDLINKLAYEDNVEKVML